MNEIRIRESRAPLPGEVVQTFTWKNPKPPKPIKDPALKYEREQRRLDDDAGLFKARATFAGL